MHRLTIAGVLTVWVLGCGTTEAPLDPVTGGGAGGLAGASAAGAGSGGAEPAGSGGEPSAGQAGALPGGSGGSAGEGGEAGTGGGESAGSGDAGGGAPFCTDLKQSLGMCQQCSGVWKVPPSEPVEVLHEFTPLTLTYCKDGDCQVRIRTAGEDSVGAVHTDNACVATLDIKGGALHGTVDVTRTGYNETRRITVTIGYLPTCTPAPSVDMAMSVSVTTKAGLVQPIGCEVNPEPVVGCPVFPPGATEHVKVCSTCLTDTCANVPESVWSDMLIAFLGNQLRRHVGALVRGACAAPDGWEPAGEACTAPLLGLRLGALQVDRSHGFCNRSGDGIWVGDLNGGGWVNLHASQRRLEFRRGATGRLLTCTSRRALHEATHGSHGRQRAQDVGHGHIAVSQPLDPGKRTFLEPADLAAKAGFRLHR